MALSLPETAGIGYRASEITGDAKAGAHAAGIAAFIQSVTGSSPEVIRLDGDRVLLATTAEQKRKMQTFMDAQVAKGLTSKEQPKVTTDLSQAFTPWISKYAVPAALGLFLAGYLTSRVINR